MNEYAALPAMLAGLVAFGLFTVANLFNIHDESSTTLAVVSTSVWVAIIGTAILRRRNTRRQKSASSR